MNQRAFYKSLVNDYRQMCLEAQFQHLGTQGTKLSNPKLGRGRPLGTTPDRRNERDGLERPGPRAIVYIAQIPRLTRRTPKLGWLYLFIFMPQHPTFLVSLFTMAPRMATVLVT